METVCESGVGTAEQIGELRRLRYSAVLIGEALVTAKNPVAFVHQLFHT